MRYTGSQLRNLVVCPKDQGVVWYVSETAIVEQDVRAVDSVSLSYYVTTWDYLVHLVV